MKSEKITAFALAISLGVICADFTTPLRASAKCNRFDITCNPHIKPLTKPLVEQAWGEAGAVAYPAAADVMRGRNGGSQGLDVSQKQHLRPHFGDLVDRVVIVYGARMMDQWSAGGKEINLSGVDTAAQTYCNRIYVRDSYKSNDSQQLVTLSHEMTHSKQCEELGGEGKFGFHYFREFKRAGQNYENNKLEQEAYSFANQFASLLSTGDSTSSITPPAASNYQSFRLQTGTALEQTGDNFAFGVLPNGDLVGIKKAATGTGKTEVHILTAASNYQSFRLQTGTALEQTGDSFAFSVLPNGDLVAIKKSSTGTGKTEVHILTASSNYQSFRLQTGTALEQTGDNFAFGVLPNGDLVGIKKSGTGTGKTEVHILAAH